jgi:hypothetical protein
MSHGSAGKRAKIVIASAIELHEVNLGMLDLEAVHDFGSPR